MSDKPARKSAAELLKQAMAAKKATAPGDRQTLRPDTRKAKAQVDAARRAGKSRKVH